MDQSLKKKWVEALLSGKYEQGDGYMRYGDNYCCLGVLQDVCLKEGMDFLPIWGATEVLPAKLSTSLDMPQWIARRLAKINDSGVPFDMIAGLIDEAL